jgi:diguanylate cyclase (GGDEF)-like protein
VTSQRARTRTARKPMLLALVYGVFLVLVSGMAGALALLIGSHFSSAIMGTTVAHDRALIGVWADTNVSPEDLRGGTIDVRRPELERELSAYATRGGIQRIEVFDTAGNLLLSSSPGQPGSAATTGADFALAAAGSVAARLVGSEEARGALPWTGPVIQEFLPLVETGGGMAAIVAIWRDGQPMLTQVEGARRDVMVVTAVGAAVLGVVLMVVFRAAHRRLQVQSMALVETTRRDPLTGMLNHGSAVAALAERLELARGAGASLSVALIDVDNFRLLNETHGHSAGDAVLSAVATMIGNVAPSGCVTGRYGPDEFIVIGPPVATEIVDQVVGQVRDGLRLVSVRFGTSEALPVTVSAGLATFPNAALGATDLLVAAAHVQRAPGARHRGRHEGPLYQAPFGGRRPLRRLPRPAARPDSRATGATAPGRASP